MGDFDQLVLRPPEPITITVLRARDLRGQRGDTLVALVKLEFCEKSLGETVKLECAPDKPAEFNYNATVNATFDEMCNLEEIAYRQVLCTVIEVLPKEKKQKEEKTVVLGQCTVDLFPLLKGDILKQYTLPINPLAGAVIPDHLTSDQPKPELDVQISVNEPLLSEAQSKETNLLSITIESLFSPPETWQVAGPAFHYTACLPVPASVEKENTIVFAGGQLKLPVDKEAVSKQKKWAVAGNTDPNSMFIHDSMLASDAIDDETGDLKANEDQEHRRISEYEKNRVQWNIERRCFLDAFANKSFQEKISKARFWPVEVFRTGMPPAAKGKKLEDDSHIAYHGVVYLNLAPLLYPGCKRIRGAYKVFPFIENEVLEKTQHKGNIAEEATKIAANLLSIGVISTQRSAMKKDRDESKIKDTKKGGTPHSGEKPSNVLKVGEPVADPEAGVIQNPEGQLYADARSYIMVEMELQRPLVAKREYEELAQKVAEYIPPRPLYPKVLDGAAKSVEDFQTQIGLVARSILTEFREQFGDEVLAGLTQSTDSAMLDKKEALVYHLNSTGKYFAFKEQLKYAVIKIVHEKCLKKLNFQDQDELQAFLSELYVYLVDQMHVGLGKVLSMEDQAPIPEPLTDLYQLKMFAREAEVNENFTLATKYYQERIARDRNDPDHWLDYGTFCLYLNDLTKAEECFKECVSINQTHLQGLLLYGVVCTMQDKHDVAETFFEMSTRVDPKSMLAWTMLGLFYDGIGNINGTEMAFSEAHKLNMAIAREEREAEREAILKEMAEKELLEHNGSLRDIGHHDLTDDKAGVSLSLQHVELDSPTSMKKAAMSPTGSGPWDARHGRGPINLAPKGTEQRASASKKGRLGHNSADLTSRPGSTHTKSPAPAVQEENEDMTFTHEPTPVLPVSIFMQAVDWLLEVKAMPFTERALSHHLLDANGGPSAEYHIALARLKLQKDQLSEAEDSLKEALQFDYQNPDSWAVAGHVKYLLGETENAKDCYERTLAFVTDPSEVHSIYLRLASIYLHEGRFQDAKNTFLMACRKAASCVAWLGVGMACYRMDELTNAEDALAEANILNNSDPEVWAYLCLVCLRTNRPFEAEQAYKYAITLNLQDEELLKELHELQQEVGFGNPQF